MSTLALMRVLESAPSRYERGMRWLTLGRVDAVREAVVAAVRGLGHDRPAVLELGCGTGALTAALVAGGAHVTALDQNPEMLALARARLSNHPQDCLLIERTASEIDRLDTTAFDAIVASFSLSEMSPSERRFVLARARLGLRPGGVLVVADEVRPRGLLARLCFAALRAPQALVGWIAVGSVSRPIGHLDDEITAADFEIQSEQRWLAGHLAVIVADSPG